MKTAGRRWLGSERLVVGGLCLITAVAYVRVAGAGFIWDDGQHVVGSALASLPGLERIWTTPGATQQYYPVAYTGFWVQWHLWKAAPAGYHAVNVLFHAAVVCLLYRALRLLSVPGAALGAAVFAVHPVAVETVAWVSEQKNTLSALFYLSATLAFWRFEVRRSAAGYALASSLFLMAILAKSVAATLPAALLVVIWWKRGKIGWRRDFLPLAPWLVAGVAVGRLTAWVERTWVARGGMGYHLTAPERVLIAGRATWFYLEKLVVPRDFSFMYPRWVLSASDPRQWVAPVTVMIVLATLWALRSRGRGPLAAALLYVGTLVPALGFVDVFPFQYSFVADHFQYLASAFALPAICAGLVWLAQRWAVPTLARTLLASAALGGLAVLTFLRTGDFRDSPTLWRATLAQNPGSWMAYNNLGTDLMMEGKMAEAIESIRTSLRIKPDNVMAQVNLADALHKVGDTSGAEDEYRRALAREPANVAGNANFGVLLYDEGRTREAIEHYRAALAVEPDYELAQGNLADALMGEGRLDEAVAAYQTALREDPDDFRTRTNWGTALMRQGRPAKAISVYREAIQTNPRYAIARLDMGNAWLQVGKVEAAIESYRTAIGLNPRLPSAHNNLGYALLRAGRPADALEAFTEELEVNPSVVEHDEGYRLLHLGETSEALAQFKRALGGNP
ncbi:MAG TPA: tetratricopeptide repeat protein [Opitutaceae bacterium]|jgi:tetratricopeptide (TPR) repeat protein